MTIDPLKRTNANADDIVSNILDIIDDYGVFTFSYAEGSDKRQEMMDEIKLYVENLNK